MAAMARMTASRSRVTRSRVDIGHSPQCVIALSHRSIPTERHSLKHALFLHAISGSTILSFAIWCTSLSLFPGADSCALPNAISATIDLRIAELVDLKTAVDSFAKRLCQVMAHKPGQVFIQRRGGRTVIAYDYAIGRKNDLALGMRRVLMDEEKTHGFLLPSILDSIPAIDCILLISL